MRKSGIKWSVRPHLPIALHINVTAFLPLPTHMVGAFLSSSATETVSGSEDILNQREATDGIGGILGLLNVLTDRTQAFAIGLRV